MDDLIFWKTLICTVGVLLIILGYAVTRLVDFVNEMNWKLHTIARLTNVHFWDDPDQDDDQQ